MGSASPNILNRPTSSSSSRPHSLSVSLGHLNPTHRVNRRKSSASVHGVNRAAIFAAVQEASQGLPIEGRPQSQHGKMGLSHVLGTSPASNANEMGDTVGAKSRKNTSAVVDGPPLSSVRTSSKNRNRRASEGSRLVKERRKSVAGELKCETCGKGYKHGSCLQKHLWEHTPEWALTSKLLISKHQQVQLLEAASVLVSMNHQEKAIDSDASSESPAASGSSDPIDDEDGSSRTSTPEQEDDEGMSYTKIKTYRTPRRQDSYSSVFSRSNASSLPNDSAFHHRRWSSHSRPSTGYAQTTAEEQADMAAAAEGLVNCSLGTPQFRAYQLDEDVPPVPPLPAKFVAAAHAAASPYLRPQSHGDVYMSDEERKLRSVSLVIEEDDDDDGEVGLFGRMEQ